MILFTLGFLLLMHPLSSDNFKLVSFSLFKHPQANDNFNDLSYPRSFCFTFLCLPSSHSLCNPLHFPLWRAWRHCRFKTASFFKGILRYLWERVEQLYARTQSTESIKNMRRSPARQEQLNILNILKRYVELEPDKKNDKRERENWNSKNETERRDIVNSFFLPKRRVCMTKR